MAKQAHETARAHVEGVYEDSYARVMDGDTERGETIKKKWIRFSLTAAMIGKAVRNREEFGLIGNCRHRGEVDRRNLVIPAVA
jgi:hypothetical protein